jgi:hypothetical protein
MVLIGLVIIAVVLMAYHRPPPAEPPDVDKR